MIMKKFLFLTIIFISLFILTSPVGSIVEKIARSDNPIVSGTYANLSNTQEDLTSNKVALASQSFSLKNRYSTEYINDVFVDNILLTLLYMDNVIPKSQSVDWEVVRQDREVSFTLNPGETFAFHGKLNPNYENSDTVVKTTNSRFIASEGFRTSGKIYGDGVCHLASFINLVAIQAGLDVYAPVRHDFAVIPDVNRKIATSINSNDAIQNMYVTNSTSNPIEFIFSYNSESLEIRVESISK
jgi:hypothetical protein